jgi:DNA-binding transcriptional regulator YiaG
MNGAQIKAYRDAIDIGQVELGRRLGVTQTTVSRWERSASPVLNADMLELALLRLLDEKRVRDQTILSTRPEVGNEAEQH